MSSFYPASLVVPKQLTAERQNIEFCTNNLSAYIQTVVCMETHGQYAISMTVWPLSQYPCSICPIGGRMAQIYLVFFLP